MIASTRDGNTVQPIYNGVNDRVGQTVDGNTTDFALDIASGLPEVIYTSEGNSYLHLPGVIVAESAAGETRYLLSDGLGSVRQGVDENGAIITYNEFDPYGNPVEGGGEPYGFTGEWWQAEVGLLHLRARWLMPETGTFLSVDPVESEPPYLYVRGNPVNSIDPRGLCAEFGDGECWAIYEQIIALCQECVAMERPLAKGSRKLYEENTQYLQDVLERVRAGWRPSLAPSIAEAVKLSASRFGVPWQILGGVLESEIQLDTDPWDPLVTKVFVEFPPAANLWPDPGPGIGNIHISTAKSVTKYFEETYPCSDMQLFIQQDESNWQVSVKLADDQFTIRVMAAYVRQLADYRFGSNGQPLTTSHANLAEWTITDAVAIWHGYRFGVPEVSPDGQGFEELEDFQDRSYNLNELIYSKVIGTSAIESARDSVPIFEKYFAMQ